MKKTLLILFTLFSALILHAQEIRWMSLEEALAKQKKAPKPIFMEVYTDWYAQCKMLENNTFRDPEVIEIINRNFYPVKFNAEGNVGVNFQGNYFDNPSYDPNRKGRNSAHELTNYLKVQGYPSMYILDKNGDVQTQITGYKTSEELLRYLR